MPCHREFLDALAGQPVEGAPRDMYRSRANCGILIFWLILPLVSRPRPVFALPRKAYARLRLSPPAPACQSLFRDDARDAEMGLSYVGHDEGQCSHTLVLRLGRQDPTNRPSCNATVSTSVTIPAEFGPAARGPRLFSLLPCRLVCPCGVLHFPLLPRRCSSPLTPPSPHLLQDMCRVVSRGEGGILVVWWYPPHLVGGAAANPGAASTLN